MQSRMAVIALTASLAAAWVCGLAYSRIVPFGEKPDEPSHMARIVYEAQYGRSPSVTSPPVFPNVVLYEAVQPPVYYKLASLVLKQLPPIAWSVSPAGFLGCVERSRRFVVDRASDPPFHVLVLRVLSLTGAVLAGVLVFHTARLLKAPPPQAIVAAVLSTVFPQMLFIASSVSNDGLGFLFGSVMVLVAVQAALRRSVLLACMTGGMLPVALGIKLAFLPYLIGIPLLVLALCPRRPVILALWTVAGAVVAGLAAYLLLPLAQHAGHVGFLRGLHLQAVELTPKDYASLIPELLATYWARFGWMDIVPPLGVGVVWISLLALASLGWIRGSGQWRSPLWPLWILMIAAVAGWALTLTSSNQTQGRFLFPFAGVIGLLLARGLSAIPIRGLPVIVVAAVLGTNLMCLSHLRAHYQPAPWPADLVIDAHQCYADRIVLETLSEGSSIGQSFACERPGLRAIDVVFSGRAVVSSEAVLSIEDCFTGHTLAEARTPVSTIVPDRFTRFRFEPVWDSGDRMLRFTLRLAPPDSGGTLSLRYALGDPYLAGTRLAGGNLRDGDLRFVAWADTAVEVPK